MTNHIHIIAVARNKEALARAVGRTHFLYTQYVNRMHKRSGHLWQNRFYSCPMDPPHLWKTMRYVVTNRLRAKMVREPWLYPYSSAGAHVEKFDPLNLLDMKWWKLASRNRRWKETLTKQMDEQDISSIRLATNRGRPGATDSFLSKLEKTVGRRLRPLPVGRPKKKSNTEQK